MRKKKLRCPSRQYTVNAPAHQLLLSLIIAPIWKNRPCQMVPDWKHYCPATSLLHYIQLRLPLLNLCWCASNWNKSSAEDTKQCNQVSSEEIKERPRSAVAPAFTLTTYSCLNLLQSCNTGLSLLRRLITTPPFFSSCHLLVLWFTEM